LHLGFDFYWLEGFIVKNGLFKAKGDSKGSSRGRFGVVAGGFGFDVVVDDTTDALSKSNSSSIVCSFVGWAPSCTDGISHRTVV
jgi:hypothetical protein